MKEEMVSLNPTGHWSHHDMLWHFKSQLISTSATTRCLWTSLHWTPGDTVFYCNGTQLINYTLCETHHVAISLTLELILYHTRTITVNRCEFDAAVLFPFKNGAFNLSFSTAFAFTVMTLHPDPKMIVGWVSYRTIGERNCHVDTTSSLDECVFEHFLHFFRQDKLSSEMGKKKLQDCVFSPKIM